MALRQHPREAIVNKAMTKMRFAIDDAVTGLTPGEALRVVSQAASEWIGLQAKWMIRAERHPDDPTKPGGWE